MVVKLGVRARAYAGRRNHRGQETIGRKFMEREEGKPKERDVDVGSTSI